MPTGDRRINIYPKRLLSLTGVDTQFLTYLMNRIDEVMSSVFSDMEGTLDDQLVGLTSIANDTFAVDTTNADKGLTGAGHIIDLALVGGAGVLTGIPFENTLATPYHVGIRHQEVPYNVVEINPLTGDAEYPSYKQTYGEMGAPTSVGDGFTFIRIVVNTITEASVNHTGRTVKVWLANPVSGVDSVAFWSGTIFFGGVNNYVDIPYSGANGPLGQDTSSLPPSTTPGDYVVFIEGATWRKNTDLSLDPTNYWYIGTVTGSGAGTTPTAFNTSAQNPALLISLDKAYDTLIGTGAGRQIALDAGAVELTVDQGAGGAGDTHRAAIRVDRIDNAEVSGLCFEALATELSGVSFAGLEALYDGVGTDLLAVEPVTMAAVNTINFTRAGPTPLLQTFGIIEHTDLVVLHNDLGAYAGLYLVTSILSETSIKVRTLDGVVPAAWAVDSGTATLVRPQIWAAGPDFAAGAPSPKADGLKGVCFARVPIRIFPFGQTAMEIKNSHATAPVTRSWFDSTGILNSAGAKFTPEGVGGDTVDVDSASIVSKIGVMVRARGMRTGTACGRVIEASGRMGAPHRFYDDFNYRPAAWTTGIPASLVHRYANALVGAASDTLMLPQGGNNELFHGGMLGLRADLTASNNYAILYGPDTIWYPKNNWFLLFFRYGFDATTNNRKDTIALVSGSTAHQIGFEYEDGLNANWRGFSIDGTGAKTYTANLGVPVANTLYTFCAVVTDNVDAYYHSSFGGVPTNLPLWVAGGGLAGLAANNAFTLMAKSEYVGAPGAGVRDSYLDYWEWEDDLTHWTGA